MALTPADVHNVAFSRPRIGKRGYSEQEVDLFIDLVEQELIRHIAEGAQLRDLNAKLRNRDGGLQKREAELADREAELADREAELADREAKLVEWEAALRRHVRKHEAQLAQHKAELAQREAKLAQRPTPLAQQVALLRHRESQVAQREAQLKHLQAQHAEREAELGRQEVELVQWETELRHQAAELRQRLDQQQAVAACVGAETATNDVSRAYGNPQQLTGAPSKSAAVNGTSRREEMRSVPTVQGRHDMERMAIRAVTDTLGNTVTETVRERTRRSPIGNGGRGPVSEHSPELEQLKEENAELTRSLGLLKAAAALLAAAMDRP